MKDKISIGAQWFFACLFFMFALASISDGGVVGFVLLVVAGLLMLPLPSIRNFIKSKWSKFNPKISVIGAIIACFIGLFFIPVPEESSVVQGVPTLSIESTVESTVVPTSTHTTTPTEKVEVVSKSEVSSVKVENVPTYTGNPYVVIDDNVPTFSSEELTTVGYEKYSPLDELGRCGVVIASCGKEIMPTGERGDISSVTPSGWCQAKYEIISGKYLYNRCHLIGWQLSGEDDNECNLITGTQYLNIEGMLPFENMVADYIKETDNHVAYRVTPVYEGNNLVPSGVQMEAYSIEDDGEGICFNVYCYNVQPGVSIDYANGESMAGGVTAVDKDEVEPVVTNVPVVTQATVVVTPEPVVTSEPVPTESVVEEQPQRNEVTVYVSKTGSKYHSNPNCSGMNNPTAMTQSEAENIGKTPCKNCY